MKTKYLKLTKEQRGRGVCFSSQLGSLTIHEIMNEEYDNDPIKAEKKKEKRLKHVDSFKDSPFVHTIRTK